MDLQELVLLAVPQQYELPLFCAGEQPSQWDVFRV